MSGNACWNQYFSNIVSMFPAPFLWYQSHHWCCCWPRMTLVSVSRAHRGDQVVSAVTACLDTHYEAGTRVNRVLAGLGWIAQPVGYCCAAYTYVVLYGQASDSRSGLGLMAFDFLVRVLVWHCRRLYHVFLWRAFCEEHMQKGMPNNTSHTLRYVLITRKGSKWVYLKSWGSN